MKCASSVCLLLTILNSFLFAIGKQQRVFLNQFAVHVPSGEADVEEIAAKHGFVNIGQVTFITT